LISTDQDILVFSLTPLHDDGHHTSCCLCRCCGGMEPVSRTQERRPVGETREEGLALTARPAVAPPDKGHRCGVDMPMENGIPEVQPLTDAQKDVIHSTAPVLAEHGFTITKRFCRYFCAIQG